MHIPIRTAIPNEAIEKDESNGLVLWSVIEEIIDDESFLIHLPTHRGLYYEFPLVRDFTVRFSTETSMFSFKALFRGVVRKDGLVMLARLRRISDIVESQMRRSYRLECSIYARILRHPEHSYEAVPTEKTCKVLDLSDNGACVVTSERIVKREKFMLAFDIDFFVAVECEARRVFRSNHPDYIHGVGCQFLDLDQKSQDRIYGYIMKVQIERRRLTR